VYYKFTTSFNVKTDVLCTRLLLTFAGLWCGVIHVFSVTFSGVTLGCTVGIATLAALATRWSRKCHAWVQLCRRLLQRLTSNGKSNFFYNHLVINEFKVILRDSLIMFYLCNCKVRKTVLQIRSSRYLGHFDPVLKVIVVTTIVLYVKLL